MSACPRRWEAEAVEDGRLDGAGRASFERHTSTCSDCSREVEILARLRTARELPFAPLRSMDRRRRRAALLLHANQEILGMPRRSRARRAGAFAATLLVVGAGFAEWRDWHAGRFALTKGIAATGVTDAAERALEPGRAAANEEKPAVALDVSPTEAAELAEAERGSDVAKGRPASRKKRGEARVRPAASARESRAPEAEPPAPSTTERADGDAGALFASAMQAFEARSYRKADELFHRFALQFSDDPRAEDALFLRVVCALRRGDRAAVEAHAHEYLGTHPEGLRRHEVERLLN